MKRRHSWSSGSMTCKLLLARDRCLKKVTLKTNSHDGTTTTFDAPKNDWALDHNNVSIKWLNHYINLMIKIIILIWKANPPVLTSNIISIENSIICNIHKKYLSWSKLGNHSFFIYIVWDFVLGYWSFYAWFIKLLRIILYITNYTNLRDKIMDRAKIEKKT